MIPKSLLIAQQCEVELDVYTSLLFGFGLSRDTDILRFGVGRPGMARGYQGMAREVARD